MGKFIDTPLKFYSSGMYVRLAFAVAAHLDPEILLVDEVLSVGDTAFQRKCLGKMGNIATEGRTVIFVSHNLSAINNLCQRGIVLESGQIVHEGAASDSVQYYLGHLDDSSAEEKGVVEFEADPAKLLQLRRISLMSKDGNTKTTFEYIENIYVKIEIDLREPSSDYYSVLFITDIYGNMVLVTSDDDFADSEISRLSSGKYSYEIMLPSRLLKPGKYHLTVSLTAKNRGNAPPQDRRDNIVSFDLYDSETLRGKKNAYRKTAIVAPEIFWKLSNLWT